MNIRPSVRHWSEFDDRAKRVISMMLGCKENMIYVSLTNDDNARVENFVNHKVVEKMKEGIHQKDNNQEHKRSTTGQSGELAVEKLAKHFIVRISWVFGINGNNFINMI